MNGQEITVAAELGLPVIYIVLNDGALGMVKHGQRLAGAEPIGFELPRSTLPPWPPPWASQAGDPLVSRA